MKMVKLLEGLVRVMATPALYVRMKIDHDVIKKIVTTIFVKYSSSIILEKKIFTIQKSTQHNISNPLKFHIELKLHLSHMIMYNQKLGEGYSFFKYRA